MTLWAALAAFGAFLVFTAGAFLPPLGMLVGLGAGGELNFNYVLPDIF